MITPMIHRLLTRGDLGRLVDEMARLDVAAGRSAELALEGGDVDAVLDSPVALEAVRGRGGAPAPLPPTLLWDIPIRAELRVRGVTDVQLADYTATLPVVFATSRPGRVVARGENGGAVWGRVVSSLPPSTVAQAGRAADSAPPAVW